MIQSCYSGRVLLKQGERLLRNLSGNDLAGHSSAAVSASSSSNAPITSAPVIDPLPHGTSDMLSPSSDLISHSSLYPSLSPLARLLTCSRARARSVCGLESSFFFQLSRALASSHVHNTRLLASCVCLCLCLCVCVCLRACACACVNTSYLMSPSAAYTNTCNLKF
jgi:hypothetical protein